MPSGRRGGAGAVRGVAWQPSRMLKHARASEREGQYDLQIASDKCMLAVLAAGGVRGAAWQPSRMLKHARVSEREGRSDLQIANENAWWSSWRQAGGKVGEPALGRH